MKKDLRERVQIAILKSICGDFDEGKIVGTKSLENNLVDFIEQELDRAREEGRKAERDRIFRGLDSIDCIKEALPKNYSASGMQFGIYRAKEIVLEKELSKLTTK